MFKLVLANKIKPVLRSGFKLFDGLGKSFTKIQANSDYSEFITTIFIIQMLCRRYMLNEYIHYCFVSAR